ncbi:MAG: hypothetical protein PUA72_02030 [Lachnospiraceae bacterium]|nr:hypothetical protein [Lachnospiraceae bacterium]
MKNRIFSGMLVAMMTAGMIGTAQGGAVLAKATEVPETEALIGGDPATWAPEEFDSAEALSKEAGFCIYDLNDLPFSPEETVYQYLRSGVAEIIYQGTGTQKIRLRKAEGEEDISGDYIKYEQVSESSLCGIKITVKENADGCHLVMWSDEANTWVLSFTEGVEEKEAFRLFTDVMHTEFLPESKGEKD